VECETVEKHIQPKTKVRCIGAGGFGVVVTPAFLQSKTITVKNNSKYVTKILRAQDAQREYALAKKIKQLVGCGVGMFPIGELEDFNVEKIDNKLYFFKQSKQLTRYGHGKKMLKNLKCIQYKKFKNDFCSETMYLRKNPDVTEYLFSTLEKKLHKLHSKNIVHMDIMCENIAYISDTKACFFDFGLAHVLDSAANLNKLIKEYADRQEKLLDEYLCVLDDPIGNKLEAYFKKYRKDAEKMIKFFKCIDFLMLLASKCEVYNDNNKLVLINYINKNLLQ
jgi:serine/threonine protein kinase